MTFGKRQLVIAAMVTALGTAVYLNWQFSGVEPVSVNDTPSSISTSKQLGQTTYVNTEVSNAESSKKPESSKTESSKTEKETQSSKVKQTVSESKSNLTKEQQEYFSSERAKRSQSQDKATEALNVGPIGFGKFAAAIINFLLMALIIFILVKSINKLMAIPKKKKEEEPAAPTTKKCPFCISEIDIAATRCPHCTAVIELAAEALAEDDKKETVKK